MKDKGIRKIIRVLEKPKYPNSKHWILSNIKGKTTCCALGELYLRKHKDATSFLSDDIRECLKDNYKLGEETDEIFNKVNDLNIRGYSKREIAEILHVFYEGE